MNTQYVHMFDNSVCLTRTQMDNYLDGRMAQEECHAAEHHLSECPFCSLSVDNASALGQEGIAHVHNLNSIFLKEHFHSIAPQIHLNSMGPRKRTAIASKQHNGQPVWRNSSIAMFLIVGLGLLWYLERVKTEKNSPLTNTPAATEKVVERNTAIPQHTAAGNMNVPAGKQIMHPNVGSNTIKKQSGLKVTASSAIHNQAVPATQNNTTDADLPSAGDAAHT